MPLLLALISSAALHVSLLLSDGWTMPNTGGDGMDVVLAPPASERPPPAATPARPKRPEPAPAGLAAPTTPPTPPVTAPSAAETHADQTPPAALAESAPAPLTAPGDAPASAPVGAVAVNSLPVEGVWRYRVTRGEGGLWVGNTELRWRQNDGRYEASSRVETVGLAALFVDARAEQYSQGALVETGLRADEFRQQRKQRSERMQIDYAEGVARGADRDVSLGGDLSPVQDLLSMYYQLGLLLAHDAPPADVTLRIASGRKLDVYRFARVDAPTLHYGHRVIATQHLRARNGADLIEFWYAAHWPVPLRMRFVDRKGDVYEQWLEPTEHE